MKIKELFETWLQKHIKLSVKIRSYNKYDFIIRKYIIPLLGKKEVTECDKNVIQEYVCRLLKIKSLKADKVLAHNTIQGIIQVLKQGFKFACELELITKNPTLKIKLPSSTEKEVQALSREEQKIIENYCFKSHKANYIGIIISLYTGIRLGELLALTWQNIDFDKKLMFIKKTAYSAKVEGKNIIVIDKPKTKKANRVIPIPDKLLSILLEYKAKAKCEYVISTRHNTIVEAIQII